MRAPAAFLSATLLVMLAVACGRTDDDSSVVRGRGLRVAPLPPAAEAAVYDAAVRAAFDVGPDLTLLLHPRRLSRTAGYSTGDVVPSDLIRGLRARGVVRGTCEPKHDGARDTPRCAGPAAGYVIRGSNVFRVGRDTVQMNFAAERFGAAVGPKPEALRFEKIYQLVGSGENWRVVREARVRETAP